MSITPMDLQTMFVRLNDVGKEQNNLKEAVASQQAAGAKLILENEIRQDHSVNKAEEESEAQKLKDEENGESQRENNPDDEKENPQKEKVVFRDPEIGSHIDISG